ncbi:integrin beta-like protein 1 [Haliotis rubra]|uniref:integrin beta-like protein 1 n=1 Tax=Haliotis rubra TaxID=36100 RepID=UPI001EE53A15|nr:integrin beta-like protein 1 [Haliotis rubra]
MDILAVVLLLTAVNLAVSRKPICPTNATSCSECITANVRCAWCSEGYFREPRCFPFNKLKKGSTCYEKHIVSPERIFTTIRKAREIRRNRPITPQLVNLHLRRGAKANIPFRVKAKKTPVIMRFRYPRGVRVTVQADCEGFEWKKKIAKCPTSNGNVVNVTMTVQMKRCLPKPKKIKVIVGSFKKRPLKVLLTSVCRCDCEKPDEAVIESVVCHKQGTYACGLCSCNEGRYGDNCECGGRDQCIARGMTEECSGRGTCFCGRCQCNSISSTSPARYSGRFCQCDDTACVYHQGEVCGGRDRGLCKCGKCVCFPGHRGPSCEISMAVDRCRNPETSMLCSGLGRCVDNVCECEERLEPVTGKQRISGQYCQCDSGSCDYFNGMICGGRGRCSCGQCICNDGFSGEDCSFDMSVDKCKSPATGLICNGHGDCVSNRCMCERPYAGPWCEECPTCPGQCQMLKDCVMCFAFSSGPLHQDACQQRCQHLKIEVVDDVAVMERGGPNYRMCLLRDEDTCLFKFAYVASGHMRVRVERTRMCP